MDCWIAHAVCKHRQQMATAVRKCVIAFDVMKYQEVKRPVSSGLCLVSKNDNSGGESCAFSNTVIRWVALTVRQTVLKEIRKWLYIKPKENSTTKFVSLMLTYNWNGPRTRQVLQRHLHFTEMFLMWCKEYITDMPLLLERLKPHLKTIWFWLLEK